MSRWTFLSKTSLFAPMFQGIAFRALRQGAARRRSRQMRQEQAIGVGDECEARILLAAITVDDSGGSDFTTIQAAVNAAAAGDVITVNDGTYNETVSLQSIGVGGTLTIQAANPQQAFWNDAGAALTASGITGNFVISGFDLGTASLTNVTGVVTLHDNLFDSVSGAAAVSATVTGTGDMGLYVLDNDLTSISSGLVAAIDVNTDTTDGGSFDLNIEANTFTGLQSNGIHVGGTTNLATKGGTLTARVTDNVFSGRQGAGEDIGFFVGGNDSNDYFASILIDNNRTNLAGVPSQITDALSIDFDGTNTTLYLTVANNTFNHHDNGMFIDADSTQDGGLFNSRFEENTLNNIQEEGIHIRPFSEPGGNRAVWNAVLTGNTLTNINSDLSAGHGGIEIEVDNTSDADYTINLDVVGNVVSMAGGSPAASFLVDANSTNTATVNIERDIASNNTGSVTVDDPGMMVTMPSANAVTDDNELRTISGFVFNDSNEDGDQTGEEGVGGVPVTLTGTQAIGGFINLTTYTDINGNYSFPSVVQPNGAGYTLTVGTTAEFGQYTLQDAVADSIDSDVNPANGQFNVMFVGAGTAIDVDAGLTASIAEVNLSVDVNSGTEAAGTVVTVTATADAAVFGDQTVDLGVTGTGITAGDFTLSNTAITILDGQTTGSVTFTILDDGALELTEIATLTISNPSARIELGSTVSQNITIANNTPATLVVDNVVDESDGDFSNGDLSLREALLLANENADANTITFDNSLSQQAITLAGTELLISTEVTIQGLGAENLTIDADGQSRVFQIDDGNAGNELNVSISGLTITNGLTLNSDGTVNAGRGGAIHTYENLELTAVHVSDSEADSDGGGIWVRYGDLDVVDSTISGNIAKFHGGGIYSRSNTTTIFNSTVSGNTLTAGNSAVAGGGIYGTGNTVSVQFSTITGNTARTGGGLFGVDTLSHSIVANNSAPVGPDITGSFVANYTLIEDPTDATITSGTGNILNVDPDLGSLLDNGGPTPTHAFTSSSPAFNAGDPTFMANAGGVPEFDQRGTGFSRVVGTAIDLGAYEAAYSDLSVTVSDSTDPIGPGQDAVYTIVLTNNGPSDVSGVTLRNVISFPGIVDQALITSTNFTGSGSFSSFEIGANGPLIHGITLTSGSVLTVSLNVSIFSGGGTMTVTSDTQGGSPFDNNTANNSDAEETLVIPETLLVDLATDENDGDYSAGDLSLREAIILANMLNDANTITFDPSLDGTDLILSITGSNEESAATGDLDITTDITIDGQGQDITIDGGSDRATGGMNDGISDRVLHVLNGGTLTLEGISVRGGLAADGAGLTVNSGGAATLNRSEVVDNLSFLFGGGIAVYGDLTVLESSVSGNVSSDDGGGMYISPSGTAEISSSTISGNSATDYGGGIVNIGNLSVINTTISGNQARDGSAIANGATSALTNSTVYLNEASNGEASLTSLAGTFTLNNTIVSGSVGGDLSGSFYGSHNLIEDGQNLNSLTNTVTGAPNLGPLQDNGGPTLTHALLGGSPAFNAGNDALAIDADSNPLTTDQRGTGFDRVVGTVDIGAFEVDALADAVRYGSSNSDTFNVFLDGADLVVELNTVEIFRQDLGFTDSLTLYGLDGDDTFNVDHSGGIVSIPIIIAGNSQTGTPGDVLNVSGGSFTDVVYGFTNANDGSINYDGSLITYTGLEPITDTSTAVNRTFEFNGAAETIQLSDDGDVGDGELLIDSTLGESVVFAAPTGTLRIDSTTGSGVDEIEVLGVDSTFSANLTIVGDSDSGEEDTVTIQTNALDLGSGNLDVTANEIVVTTDVTTTGSVLMTAGSGIGIAGAIETAGSSAIQLDADVEINILSGSLTTAGGAITLNANVSGTATGESDGINIVMGTISTATGAITLTGVGGDTDDSNGIRVLNGTVVESTGSGTITIDGTGKATGSGVVIALADTQVSSVTGAISITGNSAGPEGVYIGYGASVVSTGTDASAATITISGTNVGGDDGIYMSGENTTVSSVSGNISITGETNGYNGVYIGDGAKVQSTGTDSNAATISIGGTTTGTSSGGGGEYVNGVWLYGADTEVSSVSGLITITGNSTGDNGVYVDSYATVRSSGTGAMAAPITITGTATGDSDDGVEISYDALIESIDGKITITGNSESDDGVNLQTGGIIRSTGTGANAAEISIMGTGTAATADDGIDLDNLFQITSTAGNIELIGTTAGDRGVTAGGGVIATDGTASVTIEGTGGATSPGDGVNLDFATQIDLTGTGNLSVTGTSSSGEEIRIALGALGFIRVDGGIATFNSNVLLAEDSDIEGLTIDFLDGVSGSNNLTVSPTGTVTLAALTTSDFTGTVTIQSGTLLVLGDVTDTAAAITIANGATLAGTGAIQAQVTIENGGTLAPGQSPGQLGTGDVTLESGSTFDVEINGATAGTQYDQVQVNGANRTVTLNGATLSVTIDSGYTPAEGTTFVLIDNVEASSTVTGTFAALAEGDSVTIDGYVFLVSYADGTDGNDVTLTLSSTPVLAAQNFNAAENQTSIGTVVATDPDLPNDMLTFSLTGGGADAARFSITSGGVLTFLTAPNFETPADSNTDNVYEVEVQVEDAYGNSTMATMLVTVTDVNEAATLTVSNVTSTIPQNVNNSARIFVEEFVLTDVDAGMQANNVTLAGADAGLFEIDGNRIYLIANAGLNAASNPTLDVQIVLDDATIGSGPEAVVDISMIVTDPDANPLPELGTSFIGMTNGNWWLGQGDANGDYNTTLAAQTNFDPADITQSFQGDFTGDGLEDTAILLTNGELYVGAATQNGEFVFSLWTTLRTYGIKTLQIGDFNADGMADIVGAFESGTRARLWVFESTGTEFLPDEYRLYNDYAGIQTTLVGNFDGINGDDLAIMNDAGVWWVAKSDIAGTEFRYGDAWEQWDSSRTITNFNVGDFNGDDVDDILGVFDIPLDPNRQSIVVGLSSGSGFDSKVWRKVPVDGSLDAFLIGDFDGDDNDDFALLDNSGNWRTGLADPTNERFVDANWGMSLISGSISTISIGDTNNDGLADILVRTDANLWQSAESTGTTFNTRTIEQWSPTATWHSVQIGSFAAAPPSVATDVAETDEVFGDAGFLDLLYGG